jgi:hypothetical protein
MAEKTIQNHLYAWLEKRGQLFITPNVSIFGKYESDLVSVSRNKMITEYEIKISISDFNREFKDKALKHRYLSGGTTFKHYTPNYYYFVFPEKLFEKMPSEIPFYSGVILVNEAGFIRCVKPAKRIHTLPASERDINYLSRGLMYRYWGMRLKRKAA